jgi:hypothetical protein
MNRKTLLSLLIIDLIVIVLAAGLIYYRYTLMALAPIPSIPEKLAPAPVVKQEKPALPPVVVSSPSLSADEPSVKPAPAKTRKIVFVYRNSKVKKVHIIGDFNDWIPRSLKKGKDHKWTVTLAIAPGDYAYNFVVDGRPIRDPNNAKICDAGRGFPNSYLKVKPVDKE